MTPILRQRTSCYNSQPSYYEAQLTYYYAQTNNFIMTPILRRYDATDFIPFYLQYFSNNNYITWYDCVVNAMCKEDVVNVLVAGRSRS
jgi:hypothetical protein